MSIHNTALMKAIGAKVDYLDKRQGVLAQNIANADTPNYQSKDLTKVDFGAVLKKVTNSKAVTLTATNPLHVGGMKNIERAKDNKDKLTYEVAPDKNGVIIEEQLVKATQTQMDYNLLLNISSTQGAMYRTALGRNG